MFGHIARFEIRYQLSSPVFLLGFVLFFLMSFGATTSENIQIGARGNVLVNSPYAILQTMATMSVIGIFLITAFVAGAVIRDEESGFAPMLRATRMGKPAYVFGRFAGATAVAFLALTSVPLGILVGSLMPWLDPAKLGPFVLSHYLYALFAFGLPTLLVISAMFFTLATLTRNLMWTYVGAVLALVLFLVSRSLLSDPAFDNISSLSDPFGISALTQITKYWTATERNTQLPALEGQLLLNRALWSGVAIAMLAVAYRGFRMDGEAPWRLRRKRKLSSIPNAALASAYETSDEQPSATNPRHTGWLQFLAIARFDAITVFKSPAFFVLLAIGVLNAYGGMRASGQFYGVDIYPVTRAMVVALQGSFGIIPLIIAIFYAGELVWRERQQRMSDMVDVTPAPDWTHLLPKIAAIVLVLLATIAVGVLTAVITQISMGYWRFELSRYLLWFVLPQTIAFVQLAILSIFVQTLVPNKMTGWALMMLYVVASISLVALGFEHNLYFYAGAPDVPLSDMNGQGHFWVARAWFQAYWSAFAVMLVVLSQLLRQRGSDTRLYPRLARLRRSMHGRARQVLIVSAIAWLGLGSWIFYNTNVLNEYRTQNDSERGLADYEKTLLIYKDLPQPRITDVTLDVQIYPHERRVLTTGSYALENNGSTPINELHLGWPDTLRVDKVVFPGATLRQSHDQLGYQIYALEPALLPGESRRLDFSTTLQSPGFRNDATRNRVVDNGTFINNTEIAPDVGVSRGRLLQDRSKRRKYGLAPELRMAKLEDESARAHHYLRSDSDWITARVHLSTDADQVPVAPGRIISDTTADGRRTLVTQSEAPIQNFFSLQSARYNIAGRKFGDIDLSIYYQPEHAYNVDRMLDAMQASLQLFGEEFAPYQFSYARILEFPAYARFAQAFSGTIPYSEGIGFIAKVDEDEKIDIVSYVTAHEIAHQWWAHQLIGADMQGSTMLSESFAQYSALLVMERKYGKEHIRRFLKYELDKYLRARGGELIEELPLARVENQPYIHYQKASLALYWLKEVVGEETVNRSLRRMLERFAFQPAPYANTRDFLRILREEAGAEHETLIVDLFERISLMDAKVVAATASGRGDGTWEVSIDIEAHKLVADGAGRESEEPLDEPFEIGVFSAEPGKKEFTASAVLAFERRQLHSGRQTVTLVVAGEPQFAGVDPYNKRIDRNSEDNIATVSKIALSSKLHSVL